MWGGLCGRGEGYGIGQMLFWGVGRSGGGWVGLGGAVGVVLVDGGGGCGGGLVVLKEADMPRLFFE